jgi:hypothetical protein
MLFVAPETIGLIASSCKDSSDLIEESAQHLAPTTRPIKCRIWMHLATSSAPKTIKNIEVPTSAVAAVAAF